MARFSRCFSVLINNSADCGNPGDDMVPYLCYRFFLEYIEISTVFTYIQKKGNPGQIEKDSLLLPGRLELDQAASAVYRSGIGRTGV